MTMSEAPFPAKSRADIEAIHRARLPIAVERAKQSPYLKSRLADIDPAKALDPDVWQQIPILTKDELRTIPPDRFYDDFCIGNRSDVVEYWRSGGSTGQPLFYPRSAEDLIGGAEGFRRFWPASGCTADDLVHISFPLGIHPVGHLYGRTAESMGLGTVWCGSGNNTPSEIQLELIRTLKPTVWAGMASYGLQLAQLAERKGFDLANSSVKKIMTAAEPVSAGKREKIERLWGAELYDQFGTTESTALATESHLHNGMHFWDDLTYFEVVDEETYEPVGVGETGILIMTPLWNNTITPFLRWNTGDIVTLIGAVAEAGDLAPYPVIKHAARTAGFFKVRGVNINQGDMEDFMHRQTDIGDFLVEAIETDALDALRVSVETRGGADAAATGDRLSASIRETFEITPEIEILEAGTLEKAFAMSVKQNRFVDRRGET